MKSVGFRGFFIEGENNENINRNKKSRKNTGGKKKLFEKYFENVQIEGIPVSSDVNAQPINKEIFQGAQNRVKNLKKYAKRKQHNCRFLCSK